MLKYKNGLALKVSSIQYSSAGCLQSILCLEDFIIASAWRISGKHLLWFKILRHSFVKKNKSWAALESRHFRGIHTVFLRRTKTNLWHPPHTQSATFFPASLFVCSQSTGEEVDLTGPDTNPLGFSMSIQSPSNLVYLILLLLHARSLSGCSLSSFLCSPLWYSCLPISLFPLTCFSSLPCCLHLS